MLVHDRLDCSLVPSELEDQKNLEVGHRSDLEALHEVESEQITWRQELQGDCELTLTLLSRKLLQEATFDLIDCSHEMDHLEADGHIHHCGKPQVP